MREMDRVFRIIDADGSGTLSIDEVRHACAMINECSTDPSKRLSDGEVTAFIEALDKDGDGHASYREFLDALREGTRGRAAGARAPAAAAESDTAAAP